MKPIYKLSVSVVALSTLAGCGYNQIQQLDESVKAAWSETLNQYQRRSDLVPQLVQSINAYTTQERQVLTEVTEARAKVGQVNVRPDQLPTEEQLKQFQAAQGQLGSALSRLMVVSERYPELRSNQLFVDLNAQLEGTENRIATARGRYIKAVETHNVFIRQFPQMITAKIMGYKAIPNFGVENQDQMMQRPNLNFSNGSNAQPGSGYGPAGGSPYQQQAPAPQPSQPYQQQSAPSGSTAPQQQPAPAPQAQPHPPQQPPQSESGAAPQPSA